MASSEVGPYEVSPAYFSNKDDFTPQLILLQWLTVLPFPPLPAQANSIPASLLSPLSISSDLDQASDSPHKLTTH